MVHTAVFPLILRHQPPGWRDSPDGSRLISYGDSTSVTVNGACILPVQRENSTVGIHNISRIFLDKTSNCSWTILDCLTVPQPLRRMMGTDLIVIWYWTAEQDASARIHQMMPWYWSTILEKPSNRQFTLVRQCSSCCICQQFLTVQSQTKSR